MACLNPYKWFNIYSNILDLMNDIIYGVFFKNLILLTGGWWWILSLTDGFPLSLGLFLLKGCYPKQAYIQIFKNTAILCSEYRENFNTQDSLPYCISLNCEVSEIKNSRDRKILNAS